jgi:hypothetical protein
MLDQNEQVAVAGEAEEVGVVTEHLQGVDPVGETVDRPALEPLQLLRGEAGARAHLFDGQTLTSALAPKRAPDVGHRCRN